MINKSKFSCHFFGSVTPTTFFCHLIHLIIISHLLKLSQSGASKEKDDKKNMNPNLFTERETKRIKHSHWSQEAKKE